MSERPIIFSTPMVRAILDGRKTQTRRPVKPQPHAPHLYYHCYADMDGEGTARLCGPDYPDSADDVVRCPYGQAGDTLWVRETHAWADWLIDGHVLSDPNCVVYRADLSCLRHIGDHPISVDLGLEGDAPYNVDILKWRPSIHMPRWAARLFLRVESVRVERLQEITDDDVVAEGIRIPVNENGNPLLQITGRYAACHYLESAYDATVADWRRAYFASAWDELNAKRGFPWQSNPWVWIYSFSRLEESP